MKQLFPIYIAIIAMSIVNFYMYYRKRADWADMGPGERRKYLFLLVLGVFLFGLVLLLLYLRS